MAIADTLLPEFDLEMAATGHVRALVPDVRAEWKPPPKSYSIERARAAHPDIRTVGFADDDD